MDLTTLDWQNATTANRNAWIKFNSLWGATPTCAPQYDMILIAGSEYLTYNAKKLYFALELYITGVTTANATAATLNLFDAGNNQIYNDMNTAMDYNAGHFYNSHGLYLQNMIFSRLTVSAAYVCIKFNGYKVTWP